MDTSNKTIVLPTTRVRHRLALAVGAVFIALTALAMPLRRADAALMDRVNEAIRLAGAPVVTERAEAFQAGVLKGHYVTFDQLVGAIIWHKDNGTLPTFTAVAAPVATTCITGDVTSLAYDPTAKTGSIAIKGDVSYVDGSFAPEVKTLNLAANQHTVLTARGVVIGSNVDACWANSSAKALYGHVTKN